MIKNVFIVTLSAFILLESYIIYDMDRYKKVCREYTDYVELQLKHERWPKDKWPDEWKE